MENKAGWEAWGMGGNGCGEGRERTLSDTMGQIRLDVNQSDGRVKHK